MSKLRLSSKKNKKHSALSGLIIAILILVLLFMFVKTLFWIALVVFVIIFGIWGYKELQNKNKQIS